jgi:hypothetical protein
MLLWSKAPPLEIHPVESRMAWTFFIPIFHWVKSQKSTWSVAHSHTKPKEFCIPIVTTVSATSLHTHTTKAWKRESKTPETYISDAEHLYSIKKRVQNFSRSVRFFPFIWLHSNARVCLRREMCYTGHYVTNTWYYRVVTNGLWDVSRHAKGTQPPPRAQVYTRNDEKRQFHPTITT